MKEYTFYRIVCKNPEIKECYVGSTTQVANRKSKHKGVCNNETDRDHNIYLYQFIRDNGGWENWDMLEIERQQLETKQESLRRERFFLESYNASLNTQIPSRTYQEKNKIWVQNNPEKCENIKKEFKKNNPEKAGEYAKKYRQNNPEKNKQQNKIYDEKRNSIKEECMCGSVYIKREIKRHEQTQKHQRYIESQNNNTPYYI